MTKKEFLKINRQFRAINRLDDNLAPINGRFCTTTVAINKLRREYKEYCVPGDVWYENITPESYTELLRSTINYVVNNSYLYGKRY